MTNLYKTVWTIRHQPRFAMRCVSSGLGTKAVEDPTLFAVMEAVTMADIAQSRDAKVLEIENTERLWNDAILRRNVDSAASFLAPEYKLIIGVEGQSLQVIPRELWLSVLSRYVIHGHQITDMHVSIWNDLAVVTLAITQAAEPLNERDISGDFLITDIWVLRNEKWLVAERHSSRQEKTSVAVRGAFKAFEEKH
jgi:hypothetical protein